MICQQCNKNQAEVSYTQIVNGKKYQIFLCRDCYYGFMQENNGTDLWAGLFGSSAPKTKRCPVCGASYADYERTGLLGCASCYDVFKEQLIPSIRRIQGKVEHVGKTGTNSDDLGLRRKLKDLQEELESALRERRYEDAGRLNREINRINKTLYGGGEND